MANVCWLGLHFLIFYSLSGSFRLIVNSAYSLELWHARNCGHSLLRTGGGIMTGNDLLVARNANEIGEE